eukprot:7635164-Pyramimonas_sp.AAC.1
MSRMCLKRTAEQDGETPPWPENESFLYSQSLWCMSAARRLGTDGTEPEPLGKHGVNFPTVFTSLLGGC